MAKPNVSTQWAENLVTEGASGNPNRQEPSSDFKLTGQPEAEPTDRQSLNYRLYAGHKRMEYFDQTLDTVLSDITNIETAIAEIDLEKNAITKADFFARVEQRKRDNAGSGFLEWGKHFLGAGYEAVNEGIWTTAATATNQANLLFMGQTGNNLGVSRTDEPLVLVNGVQHKIDLTAGGLGTARNIVRFPYAPDGTKTYDTATGLVTQHVNSASAFASETSTNKVITSRKDLVFLESWHEAIEDKNQVYYLGNVQFNGTNPYGVAQATRNDGYTRFGEWDNTTTGNYCDWSAMTDAEKLLFIDDPENNIYYDSETGQFIQVRYRIRVVEGVGDDWEQVSPFVRKGDSLYTFMNYNDFKRPRTRGSATTFTDYTDSVDCFGNEILNPVWDGEDKGLYGFRKNSGNAIRAHNNLGFALPIALVQRLNQGAYHPVYNPQGCAKFNDPDAAGRNLWYESLTTRTINSTSDCFTNYSGGAISDNVTGRTDQYDYHDAIYAGLVEDLRLNANKLDYNRLLKDSVQNAIRGKTRGSSKLPYLFVAQDAGTITNTSGFSVSVSNTNLSGLDGGQTDFGVSGVAYNLTKGQSVRLVKITATSFHTPQSIATSVVNSWDIGDRIAYTVTGIASRDLSQNGVINGISLNISSMQSKLENLNADYNSLPMVDIVGDPARIAATFPDGVIGQWLPDLGGDNLWDLNRKAVSVISTLYTDNNGISWNVGNHTLDNVRNQLNFSEADNSSSVGIISYESLSDFTENEDSTTLVSNVGNTFVGQAHAIESGNRLLPSITGNIHKGVSAKSVPISYTTTGYSLDSVRVLIDQQDIRPYAEIDYNGLDENTPTTKFLPTLVEKEGLLYLQYHAKEVVNDNTSFLPFGDDNTLPVQGVGTITDLNGNTVRTFCHHEIFPVGIADKTTGGLND